MPKLKLQIDELSVTSFEAAPAAAPEFVDPTKNTGCATCRTNCLPYC